VELSLEEDRTLQELRVASDVPQRTKDRAEALRLSHRGWTPAQIAEYLGWQVATARRAIHRWQREGLYGLWDSPRPGRPSQCTPAVMSALEQHLLTEEGTVNSRHLVEHLAEVHGISLSRSHLRRLLKKKSYRWKRTRHSHHCRQDPVLRARKQADLDLLHQAAREGYIRLKYLDESGFDSWSPVSYSWSLMGTQKCQEQTAKRSRRLSVLGLWEPGRDMSYGLVVGSLTSATYIRFMNWQATRAQRLFQRTGIATVIVQDNASIHTSKAVQERRPIWQAQGLDFFQLPPYCSEMNPIETEWHQLKAHEIRGAMFEDTYDLAMGVMTGLNRRGNQAGYTLKRFSFASNRQANPKFLTI
jgi:transposase